MIIMYPDKSASINPLFSPLLVGNLLQYSSTTSPILRFPASSAGDPPDMAMVAHHRTCCIHWNWVLQYSRRVTCQNFNMILNLYALPLWKLATCV